MLGARLLQLIQAHAGPLSRDVMDDLMTNDAHADIPPAQPGRCRNARLVAVLRPWQMDRRPDEHAVRNEYQEMGRARFREGVPVSELVYALLVTKSHLRRYIRETAWSTSRGIASPRRSSFRSSCIVSRTSTIGSESSSIGRSIISRAVTRRGPRGVPAPSGPVATT